MPPSDSTGGYRRCDLTGEPEVLTLASIPPDAPYLGEHVLYRWSPAQQAWIGYDSWNQDLVLDDSETPQSASPARRPVRSSRPKRRKGDPDPDLPLLDS